MDTSQPTPVDNHQWRRHLPYLFSTTVPNVTVRQSIYLSESVKNTNLLLVTRSDGVHKIGYLPNDARDTRLGDGTETRRAYLCKLGSILATKAGISSGGNKADEVLWDALPEILFGYEIFERARTKVAVYKASDIYVIGHPIKGTVDGLFRTPEEFAQHLLWLAQGDEEKECECVLCTKEAKRQAKKTTCGSREEFVQTWKQECNSRATSYSGATTLGSFWGNLPDLTGHDDHSESHDE